MIDANIFSAKSDSGLGDRPDGKTGLRGQRARARALALGRGSARPRSIEEAMQE